MGRPGADKILMYRSEDWLRKKFIDEKLSVAAISGLSGVSSVTIYAYLNKYELKNGKILEYGHTMFLEDVIRDLNSIKDLNESRFIRDYMIDRIKKALDENR